MSLCDGCMEVADENREILDLSEPENFWEHPENCGCPCQHGDPQQWAKQFSTEQPK